MPEDGWYVQIDGTETNILQLQNEYTNLKEIRIINDNGSFLLWSDSFQTLADETQVLEAGKKIIQRINGIFKSKNERWDSLKVVAVYLIKNGTRSVYVMVEAAHITLSAFATLTVTGGSNSSIQSPVLSHAELSFLTALKDDNYDQVLEYFSMEKNWVNLYKIFEVIRQDVGGEDQLVSNGWTTKKELSDFRQTANHPGGSGMQSRHGYLNSQPPIMPMSLDHAKRLIDAIFTPWEKAKHKNIVSP